MPNCFYHVVGGSLRITHTLHVPQVVHADEDGAAFGIGKGDQGFRQPTRLDSFLLEVYLLPLTLSNQM
jgi:hypothetical protein